MITWLVDRAIHSVPRFDLTEPTSILIVLPRQYDHTLSTECCVEGLGNVDEMSFISCLLTLLTNTDQRRRAKNHLLAHMGPSAPSRARLNYWRLLLQQRLRRCLRPLRGLLRSLGPPLCHPPPPQVSDAANDLAQPHDASAAAATWSVATGVAVENYGGEWGAIHIDAVLY